MRSAQLAREGIVVERADVAFRLNLPAVIKAALVEDWEKVTKKRFLVRVPKDGSPALQYCTTGLTHMRDESVLGGADAPTGGTASGKASGSPSRSGASASASSSGSNGGTGEPKEGDYFAAGRRGRTCRHVLDRYVQSKREEGCKGIELDAVEELASGVLLYFDRALPVYLLYRFERQQFDEVEDSILCQQIESEPDIPWSDVYGVEHLLRLFTRLPRLIVAERLSSTEQRQLQQRMLDLIRFIARNLGEFGGSADACGPCTPEYAESFYRLMESAAVLDRTIAMGLSAHLLESDAARKVADVQAKGAARAAARGAASAK